MCVVLGQGGLKAALSKTTDDAYFDCLFVENPLFNFFYTEP